MTEEERPTGITYEDAKEAAQNSGNVDFEGREVRVAGFNTKTSIDERNSARIVLHIGDEH